MLITPNCDECEAWDENPEDYVKREICPVCPWGREIQEPIIYMLMDKMALQAADCPIDRHELTDYQWRLLGIVKAEFEKISFEEAEEKRRRG